MIFKIMIDDLGNNYSKNNSGIYFDINILGDNAIKKINIVVEKYFLLNTNNSNKISYRTYSDNEYDKYERLGRLGTKITNRDKNILHKIIKY